MSSATGAAGTGGVVLVETESEDAPARIRISATAGKGGNGGQGGGPGTGGPGGIGGHGRKCEWVSRGGRLNADAQKYVCKQTGRGPDGPSGPNGDRGQKGPAGSDGTSPYLRPDGTYDYSSAFAPGPSPTEKISRDFLLMLLTRADFAFMQRDYAAAGTYYAFIYKVVVQPTEQASEELDAIRARAAIALSRLSQGLDYFGHQRNFVPTVPFRLYRDRYERVMQLAETLDALAERYQNAADDQAEKLASIDQTIVAADARIVHLAAVEEESRTRLDDARQGADKLLTTIQSQQRELVAGEDAFKAPVSAPTSRASQA